MGSHALHDWIDYNRVAFSIELLERCRTFSDLGEGGRGEGKKILVSRVLKCLGSWPQNRL